MTTKVAKATKTLKAAPESTRKQAVATKRLASVPDASIATEYVHRQIAGVDDFDIFRFARDNTKNVLIEGPTGPGKTMACRAFAAEERMAFYSIPSNVGVEPTQLFGKFVPNGQGGFVWVDGPVTDLVKHGGVLLINEVNFMPERVATVLFGLLDARREITLLDHNAETIKAHDDLLIIADMNPDYEGTRPLNKAFRNRFAIQLYWDYDPMVEAKLIKLPMLRTVIGKLREQHKAGVIETPISTNMGIEFIDIASQLGVDFAVSTFANHFNAEDRNTIANVFDVHKVELTEQIEDLENFDYEDARIKWAQTAQPGYIDPEWGVYGTDWAFDDDENEEE